MANFYYRKYEPDTMKKLLWAMSVLDGDEINTRASYVRSSVIEYAEYATALLEAELEEARNPKPSFFQWLFGK